MTRAGMTNYQLAKALRPEAKRVDAGRITRWLSGERGPKGFGNDVVKLAKILGCTVEYLQEGGQEISPGVLAPAYQPPPPKAQGDWMRVAYRLAARPGRWTREVLDAFSSDPVLQYKGDRAVDKQLDDLKESLKVQRAST